MGAVEGEVSSRGLRREGTTLYPASSTADSKSYSVASRGRNESALTPVNTNPNHLGDLRSLSASPAQLSDLDVFHGVVAQHHVCSSWSHCICVCNLVFRIFDSNHDGWTRTLHINLSPNSFQSPPIIFR